MGMSRRMLVHGGLLALAGAGLGGCQSTSAAPLAPQDYQVAASRSRAKEAVITTFLPRGFSIVRDSDYLLVLDRPASDNFAAQFLYGSRFNGTPNARVTMTFVGDNPTTVMTRIALVTNPNSGFEQITDLNGAAGPRAEIATAMAMVMAAATATR